MPDSVLIAVASALVSGMGTIFTALLTGGVVPWRTMRELRDHDRAALVEAKAALSLERTRNDVLSGQVSELLEHSRTSTSVLASIRDYVTGRDRMDRGA